MQDYPIEAYQRQDETKSRRCLRDRRKAAKKRGMTPLEYLAHIRPPKTGGVTNTRKKKEVVPVAEAISSMKDQIGSIVMNTIAANKLSDKDLALKHHLITELGEPEGIFDQVIKLRQNLAKESYELTQADAELIITLTAAEVYLDPSAIPADQSYKLKRNLKRWLAPHETTADVTLTTLRQRRDHGLLHKVSSKTMGLNIYRNMLLVEQRMAREAM